MIINVFTDDPKKLEHRFIRVGAGVTGLRIESVSIDFEDTREPGFWEYLRMLADMRLVPLDQSRRVRQPGHPPVTIKNSSIK